MQYLLDNPDLFDALPDEMCIRDRFYTYGRLGRQEAELPESIAAYQGTVAAGGTAVFPSDTPVSYTHLDVYKRQMFNFALGTSLDAAREVATGLLWAIVLLAAVLGLNLSLIHI